VFLPADRSVDREGGRMLNPYSGKPQNTRISAIIVLEVHRDKRKVEKAWNRARAKREKALGRKLTEPEAEEFKWEAICRFSQFSRKIPRVAVIDNPFARNLFPEEVFNGEFDERWRWDPDTGNIACVFRGSGLPLEMHETDQ
jgi:hypothetical protein